MQDKLAHYKCPRSLHFETRLPRTDAGKLSQAGTNREVLSRLCWATIRCLTIALFVQRPWPVPEDGLRSSEFGWRDAYAAPARRRDPWVSVSTWIGVGAAACVTTKMSTTLIVCAKQIRQRPCAPKLAYQAKDLLRSPQWYAIDTEVAGVQNPATIPNWPRD